MDQRLEATVDSRTSPTFFALSAACNNNDIIIQLNICNIHNLKTSNDMQFLSESYDFFVRFVGFFIILKNASGVVLRKGK
jgi:hypothetical protein